MFKHLHIKGWRQYEEIDIDFHQQLTILTGANGSGKTTILNLLSKHFGWQGRFVSTASRNSIKGIVEMLSGYWAELWKKVEQSEIEIGSLEYFNEKKALLRLPKNVGNEFDINFSEQQPVKGIFLPSHRPVFVYQRVDDIRVVPLDREQIYNTYSGEVRNKYYGSNSGKTLTYHIKQHLISLAAFGEGNKYLTANDNAKKLFEGFQDILRILLPKQLGFEGLLIEVPEVNLITKTGTFSLDASSGGVAAIIDIAWQIYTYADPSEKIVVTIDEPENHLHPEMQRTLLKNLMEAFPNAQFIVCTHSPLIISSVENSNVYVLNYNEKNRVVSNYLDFVNKAGTSNQILRDALGIDTSIPMWVENRLKEISNKYKHITENNYADFRQEMNNLGMGDLIPETLANILRNHDKN
jgi:predicted ATP-dependent endonuclease of OLD family